MNRGDRREPIFRDDMDRKRPVTLGEYRVPRDSATGRRHLEREREGRRQSEPVGDYRMIRRGYYFGEEGIAGTDGWANGREHYGQERLETGQEKAERIVGEELKRQKWPEAELRQRAKRDRWKVKVAARLRAETTLTVKWIAARLGMGSAGYVNGRLSRWRKGLISRVDKS